MACTAPQQPAPMMSAAADERQVRTMVTHDVDVELGAKPTAVTIPLRDAAPALLAIARDPQRHLTLRVEGISVDRAPGVIYEVRLDGVTTEVGVLSFYGVEESNGSAIAGFPIDEAVARVLRNDSRELRVTFTPRGTTDASGHETIELSGHARFRRLVVAEE